MTRWKCALCGRSLERALKAQRCAGDFAFGSINDAVLVLIILRLAARHARNSSSEIVFTTTPQDSKKYGYQNNFGMSKDLLVHQKKNSSLFSFLKESFEIKFLLMTFTQF